MNARTIGRMKWLTLLTVATSSIAASDTLATRVLSRFLGVPATRISARATDSQGRLGSSLRRFAFRAGQGDTAESGFTVIDTDRRIVTSITFSNRFAAAIRQGFSNDRSRQLQATAEAFARAHGGSSLVGQGPPSVTYVGQRVYAYTWEGKAPQPNVYSGSRIGIGIGASTGRVLSYVTWLPHRSWSVRDVKVTEEMARTVAKGELATEQLALSPTGKLVLNSPLAPNEGPVWVFEVRLNDKGVDGIIVDAIRGNIIHPRSDG